MKIAIIGCGNMGGAIARGLASDRVFASEHSIAVSNRTAGKLDKLKAEFPSIAVSTDNREVAENADVVMLAVKPWLIDSVAKELSPVIHGRGIVVSIAAGIEFSHLTEIFTFEGQTPALFRVIPNTAISIGESMTAISAFNATRQDEATVVGMFDRLGETIVVEERLMSAVSSLCSCGTAYAMRYVRAAINGGIELGLYPNQAKAVVIQTVKGAMELLKANGTHPEEEIDKVTTPGGITIKGLNRMEACGFSTAVIEGLKASS